MPCASLLRAQAWPASTGVDDLQLLSPRLGMHAADDLSRALKSSKPVLGETK